jgi:uncharacterized membrane protein
LAGSYVVSEGKSRFYFVLFLATASILVVGANQFYPSPILQLMLEILLAGFLLTMAVLILRKVLKNERVTWEKISAALCVYLLTGYFWTFLYLMANRLNPMSFRNTQGGFSDLIYYSLVTLAMVGYGDITRVGPLARSLSCLEAITGQFYLAVMIARLVGLQITHAETPKGQAGC